MHRLFLWAFLTVSGAGDSTSRWLSLAVLNCLVSFAWWDQLAGAHPSGAGGLQHPIAPGGAPQRGAGARLHMADADKPLLLQPGVCEEGRYTCTGCLVAVIWCGEGKLGACTGGLGLQQEEGKGVISRWAGSPAVCGKELAFLGLQLQAGHGRLLRACFPISSCPARTLQYLAKAGLSPSAAFRGAAEAHPVPHPQGCIPSRGEAGSWCQVAEGTCFHTWYEFSRR